MPDGATLDSNGRLWTALWDGGCVVCMLSDGTIVEKVSLPTGKVSSVTFAGDDYTDMYITTAGGKVLPKDDEMAGALFRVSTEIPGIPEFFSRIEVADPDSVERDVPSR